MRYPAIFYILFCFITISICFTAPTLCGEEPPEPWEMQSAVLAADCVVQGKAGDYRTVLVFDPNRHRKEERFVIKLSIHEILKDENRNLKIGDSIEILTPTLTELTGAPDLDKVSHKKQIPDLFKKGSEILAALIFNTEYSCYVSSSAWAYFSFLEAKNPELNRRKKMLRDNPVTRTRAEEIAIGEIGPSVSTLRTSIIGGIIQGDYFASTLNNTDPNAQCIWRVWPIGMREKVVFIDAQTGKILKLLGTGILTQAIHIDSTVVNSLKIKEPMKILLMSEQGEITDYPALVSVFEKFLLDNFTRTEILQIHSMKVWKKEEENYFLISLDVTLPISKDRSKQCRNFLVTSKGKVFGLMSMN